MKLLFHTMTGLSIVVMINSRSYVFSQQLRLIAGAYMLEINRHARWIQLHVLKRKCGIDISWVFDRVFANFSGGIAVLGTPNVPLFFFTSLRGRPHGYLSLLFPFKRLPCQPPTQTFLEEATAMRAISLPIRRTLLCRRTLGSSPKGVHQQFKNAGSKGQAIFRQD